jgi:SAM-dependent methyltransferase
VSQGVGANDHQKADYGIDGPHAVRNAALAGAAALVVGTGLSLMRSPSQPMLVNVARILGFFIGVVLLPSAGAQILFSKVGKFRERDRLLDSIPWRGDETVLDVGCGRGLLLVGAAKRLRTGRAVGVDIWQSKDQSGNHPGATYKNAQIEGVANRVEVKNGDARQLPFEDGSFDVVVSSLVLHNIRDATERKKAVQEIARVLKGGGRVAILDIFYTNKYEQELRKSGMREVSRSGLHFPNGLPPVRVVSGIKGFAALHQNYNRLQEEVVCSEPNYCP